MCIFHDVVDFSEKVVDEKAVSPTPRHSYLLAVRINTLVDGRRDAIVGEIEVVLVHERVVFVHLRLNLQLPSQRWILLRIKFWRIFSQRHKSSPIHRHSDTLRSLCLNFGPVTTTAATTLNLSQHITMILVMRRHVRQQPRLMSQPAL